MATTEIIQENSQLLFASATEALFKRIPLFPPGPVVCGLCGGRSIVGLLQAMSARASELAPEQWQRLHFFMVDERLVAADDEQCNFKMVHELFLQKAIADGLLTTDQVHPFVPDFKQPDHGLSRYAAEFTKVKGEFDIVFLGVGEDAHVAALFPGGVWTTTELSGYFTFNDSPKPPSGRMSSSPKLIRTAKLAVAMFIGEGKRQALERYRTATESIEQCPIRIIDQLPEALLLSDLT